MDEETQEAPAKSKPKPKPPEFSLQRYILTGAAIGLYFGYFFRPAREMNIPWALALSVFIGIVFMIIRMVGRQRRLTFRQALQQFPLNVAQYAFLLCVLELRHLAFDWGGTVAVVVMTGIAGALAGFWMSFRKHTALGF